MPISTTDINALPDYTDAQLLKATRAAITSITLTGTGRSINGRSLATANLPDLWDQVKALEARINEANGTGNVALVTFNEPR